MTKCKTQGKLLDYARDGLKRKIKVFSRGCPDPIWGEGGGGSGTGWPKVPIFLKIRNVLVLFKC